MFHIPCLDLSILYRIENIAPDPRKVKWKFFKFMVKKWVKLRLTMTSCGKKALVKTVWTGFGFKLVVSWLSDSPPLFNPFPDHAAARLVIKVIRYNKLLTYDHSLFWGLFRPEQNKRYLGDTSSEILSKIRDFQYWNWNQNLL